MYPSAQDESYKLLGKLGFDIKGNAVVSGQNVSQFIGQRMSEGQEVEITLKQRHDTGWGE